MVQCQDPTSHVDDQVRSEHTNLITELDGTGFFDTPSWTQSDLISRIGINGALDG